MKKAKILSAALALAVTVSGAAALTAQAYAGDGMAAQVKRASAFASKELGGRNTAESAETRLSGLVTAGTITEEQKSAILSAIKETQKYQNGRANEKGGMKNPLSSLVEAGTITEEQSKSVVQAIMSAMKENKGSFDASTVLESLVTAGTITSDQATAIKAALESAMPRLGSESSSDSSGKPSKTENSGSLARPSGTNSLKSGLDGLVAAGTITEEQKTAVLNALLDKSQS